MIRQLKKVFTAIDINLVYKLNKARCGRKKIQLPAEEKACINERVHDRDQGHPNNQKEFGHLIDDTIIGRHHKSAVIMLVERLTKCIIAIKPAGREAINIETSLNQWMNQLPQYLFRSIIFDCGKEFFNWKPISNKQDIDIFFADPGTPSQRGLNEQSNGLLRNKWISILYHRIIFLSFIQTK